METTLYAVIKLKVVSDLENIQEIIDNLSVDCEYRFHSTDAVEVLDTEWLDLTTQLPE